MSHGRGLILATVIPHAFLAGIIYNASGEYEKAVEEDKKAVGIDSDLPSVTPILP